MIQRLVFILVAIIAGVTSKQNITCKDYETFTDCIDPCTPKCAIPYQRHCEFLICNEGCLCNGGYIKNTGYNGDCIPISTCDEFCLPYQEYNECGSACPPTCTNPNPSCTDQCVPGCFCKEGYIFDDRFELCVTKCIDI